MGSMRRALVALVLLASCSPSQEDPVAQKDPYKDKLSAEQYRVLREKGTEAPFSGQYNKFFKTGDYRCAACAQVIFSSVTKFDTDCGWPSFSEALPGSTKLASESGGPEVMCAKCGSHLGHLFDDGPTPSRNRY